MTSLSDPRSLFATHFGGEATEVMAVPGRVNLIGEHIDYHDLSVLPIAIQRKITIAFRSSRDRTIRAVSDAFGEREVALGGNLTLSAPGDWENYLKAAVLAVRDHWDLSFGLEAAITSDLPPAAGLSSSSAILVAVTLALLKANQQTATFEELMAVLPEAEYFVGTRGGGMDHAAVLGSQAGSALWVHFAPFSVSTVPIPERWCFLLANSLVTAEKSGSVREAFNRRRTASVEARQKLGFHSYREMLATHKEGELRKLSADPCFLHVIGEAWRVEAAVQALREENPTTFGQLLTASHESLRDLLQVSCPALDELVEIAIRAGAAGARLTGAGFGGCALIFCDISQRDQIRAEIIEHYYKKRNDPDPDTHIFPVLPAAGALNA